MPGGSPISDRSTTFFATFIGALVVLVVGSAWLGQEYYLLPRDARPAHELHGLLGALILGLATRPAPLFV